MGNDNPQPTRIILADDHPVFRAGLRQIISADPGIAVVGEAGDGPTALELIRRSLPDVALIDFDLPKINGLELVRTLHKERCPVRLVLLTMHNVESLVHEALELGVQGYLLKDNAAVDILSGIRTVASGGVYLSPAVSAHLVRRSHQSAALTKRQPGLADLTPTERRILKLIAANKTSKEIGRELFISHRTVETHRSNICEKLELHGSNKLLQFAIEHRQEL